MPYTTWPDESWNTDIKQVFKKDDFGGFCTHSSILFLPWHRPYLALYEV
jgi:tyrosinase